MSQPPQQPQRSSHVAYSADPTLYAPVTMTTTVPPTGSNGHGTTRTRGVRGGRAPFSLPGHAPAYGRNAVYGASAPAHPVIAAPSRYRTGGDDSRAGGTDAAYGSGGYYYGAEGAAGHYGSGGGSSSIGTGYDYNPEASAAATAAAAAAAASEGSSGAGKKKSRITMRTGGGEVWEDSTMTEWDENDFRIFVGDLGHEVLDEHLAQAFSIYPSMQKAKIVREKRSGKSRGYGFVSFRDPDDFSRAMREMHGKYLGNRPLKLRKSNWRDRNVDVRRKKEREARRLGRRI